MCDIFYLIKSYHLKNQEIYNVYFPCTYIFILISGTPTVHPKIMTLSLLFLFSFKRLSMDMGRKLSVAIDASCNT